MGKKGCDIRESERKKVKKNTRRRRVNTETTFHGSLTMGYRNRADSQIGKKLKVCLKEGRARTGWGGGRGNKARCQGKKGREHAEKAGYSQTSGAEL